MFLNKSRERGLLVVFFTVQLLCSFIYTLQQPFYPVLAESKNATATEYSIVFGIYETVSFLACPLWSTMVYFTGVKQAFVSGVILQGLSVVVFGFVNIIQDLTLFLLISILIRVLEAFFFAPTFVGMYTLIPVEFPQNMVMVMAVVQMGQAIGYSIGPPIGGALYQLGGFRLPFLVVGTTDIAVGLFLIFAIWNTPSPARPPQKHSVFTILKRPQVLLNFIILLGPQIAMSYNYTLWAAFLKHTFNATSLKIGLVFGLSGFLYAISLPIWGKMASRMNPSVVVIFGLLISLPGNVLMGPLPIFGWKPSFVQTCIGISLFGGGTGGALIGGFVKASNVAQLDKSRGEAETMSLVSGCYMGFFAGAFSIGSPIAGVIYDNFGFRNGLFFTTSLLLLVLLLQILYIFKYSWNAVEWIENEMLNETSKLLPSNEKISKS